MPKLNPDNQISITHSVVSRMLGEYGIDDFVFKILDQGIENTSVRIDSAGKFYVLRVYQYGKKDDTRIELELRFQDYLREHNIPIPAVYKNQNDRELTIIDIDGKRRQIILMEFAEGESMTLHYTPRLIENLAALHTRMHLLGIEFAGKVKGESRIWTELRVCRFGSEGFCRKDSKFPPCIESGFAAWIQSS
ncbi:MAG: phosphotransferase [Candidatus Sungbacteria bacterium]|nr:phosphotransferase [Candidatus Sungbacteria bacterium]